MHEFMMVLAGAKTEADVYRAALERIAAGHDALTEALGALAQGRQVARQQREFLVLGRSATTKL